MGSSRAIRSLFPTNFLKSAVYFTQGVDDGVLVSRCLEGDDTAFEALVLRYQRLLFTVALRILGNREDASDATQNALIKMYRNLRSYDATRKFFSWAYRILVNECLNARRHRRDDQQMTQDIATQEGPADALEQSERRQRVQAAVLALPMEYREVIVLRHFAEQSYEEMSEALQIPVKTVKSRLHTARQRLGERLLGWKA